MTDHFPQFARLAAAGFKRVAGAAQTFVTAVAPDDLWAAYLAAFPDGTNPTFRKRSEHECSCCRQFVRRAGGAVAVDDAGRTTTVWDEAAEKAPHPYCVVAAAMRDKLRAAPVANLYRVPKKEASFGARQTRSQDEAGNVLRWEHLYTEEVPESLRVESPGQVCGEYRATVQVFERGLEELSDEAVEATLEMIGANTLYRGEEHRGAVVAFQKARAAYRGKGEAARRAYLWTGAHGPAAKFRGTAIGKLVDDLSGGVVVEDAAGVKHKYHPRRGLRTEAGDTTAGELAAAWGRPGCPGIVTAVRNWLGWDEVDMYYIKDVSTPEPDVEACVRAFEAMVAPTNYRRSSAVITPGMVRRAMETVTELGLEPALERRLARLEDVHVGDVKWVDGGARPLMRGGLTETLMQVASAAKGPDEDERHAKEIGLDDFVATVLPETTGLEVMFKGQLQANLVALTAPVHPEPRRLFKWDNDFAWSYKGNVADSLIAERVRKAGGKVEGAVLRVSLSWYNLDDLDLHVHEPPGRGMAGARGHIYYAAMEGWTGGKLDVDMNRSPTTREAVENVAWTRVPPDGAYRVVVNNFCQREMSGVGFVVEVESAGKVSHFSFNRTVQNRQDVHVVTLHVKGGVVERFEAGDAAVTAANVSQEVWGLQTERYAKVSCVTLSPNYWGESATGNRHTFFFLEGARCDEPARGIYNEFLHERLLPHRKVLEVVGDKTKCQPADGALCGLGFSSTKRDSFVARVQLKQGRRRLYNVRVGAQAGGK